MSMSMHACLSIHSIFPSAYLLCAFSVRYCMYVVARVVVAVAIRYRGVFMTPSESGLLLNRVQSSDARRDGKL